MGQVTRSPADRRLLWMRRFGLTAVALILACLIGAATSPVARALQSGQRIVTLCFGVDASDLSRHTDTLMVSVFDPNENYLAVLNIPRDTHATLPGYRFHRVNEIYGYFLRKDGDRDHAADMVRSGVETLLSSGPARVDVPYYVGVNFAGFERMIDLIGGVWVDVDAPMNYDDVAGNLHIHFEPGRYLLKGEDALRYVRFRGTTGDRGRIYRQQEFIRNMVRRLANPMMVFKVPRLVAVMATSIETNLSFWDFVYLAAAMRHVRSDTTGFYILPGRPSGAFWMPNRALAAEMASLIIAGRPPVDETPEIKPEERAVTVNVWNASGRSGLAYRVTRKLRASGYDVVDWGNYAAEQLQTRVVDRKGKIGNARALAELLGVDDFHSEPNQTVMVDVEVVLGRNFAGVN